MCMQNTQNSDWQEIALNPADNKKSKKPEKGKGGK